jgi:hypothetical protein
LGFRVSSSFLLVAQTAQPSFGVQSTIPPLYSSLVKIKENNLKNPEKKG